MRNIGPVTQKQLRSVGIKSLADLRSAGAFEAFKRLKEEGYHPTKNMLFALIGAIEDIDWQDVANNFDENLLKDQDDIIQNHP